MQNARTIPLEEMPPVAFSSHEPQLQVVLVYEDLEMGRLGKNVFDQIAKEVGGEGAARLTVWRFDFFHAPELTHAVSRQAVAADVIIVAPRDPNHLPPQVRVWLEEWPAKRILESGALIAVFASDLPPPRAKSSNAALLLWRAACRAQMDFICRNGTPQGSNASTETTTAAPSPNGFSNAITITHNFFPVPDSGWGLND